MSLKRGIKHFDQKVISVLKKNPTFLGHPVYPVKGACAKIIDPIYGHFALGDFALISTLLVRLAVVINTKKTLIR